MRALIYRELLNRKFNHLFILVILVLNAYFANGTLSTSIYIVFWAQSAIYTKEEEKYLRTMDYSKKEIFQYSILMFMITLTIYIVISFLINLIFSQDSRVLLLNLNYILVFAACQTINRATINHRALNIKPKVSEYIIAFIIAIIVLLGYVAVLGKSNYPMEQAVYLFIYVMLVHTAIITYSYLTYGGVDHVKNQ